MIASARDAPLSAAGIQSWWPAATDTAPQSPASVPDTAGFVAALGTALGTLTALPWDVARGTDEPALAATAGFVRADGTAVAVALPAALPAALVALRCGGGFVAVPSNPSAPSVGRARADLHTAILAAVDMAWAGTAGWSPGGTDDRIPRFTVDATAGGHVFRLGFAVALAEAATIATPPGDAAAWAHRLRETLEATSFTVRAVLHDRGISLAAAVALRVGDVVPIDTRRDIALCLGNHALARGTVTPDAGGYRVTVAAAGDVVPATQETL